MLTFFKNTFQTLNPINSGRQKGLDVAKFLIILAMLTQHTFLMFINYADLVEEINLEQLYIAFYIRYIIPIYFGANIFMFLMGIGFIYSKNNNWKKRFLRGFFIFISAYVLNFFRYFLPYDIINFLSDYPKPATLFYNDILTFAGLAIMVYELLKKLKLNDYIIFAISIILCFVGYACKDISLEGIYSNIFVGIFIKTEESMFPFCFWFFVVMSGTFFARILISRKQPNILYLVTLILSLAFILGYAFWFVSIHSFSSYAHALNTIFTEITFDTPLNVLLNVSLAIFLISLCNFLSLILPKFINKLCNLFAVNLYRIYSISWVIISWSCVAVFLCQQNFVFTSKLEFSVLFFIAIFVITFSLIVSILYSKIRTKIQHSINNSY